MSAFSISEPTLRKQAVTDGMTHLSIGVAIIQNNTILLVRRALDDFLGGSYELPGGGIESGETFAEAAKREVLEETGLSVSKIVGTFSGFDYTTDVKPRVRQFNFIVTAMPGMVSLSPEHDKYVWATLDDLVLLNLTEPMRKCVSEALRGESPHL